MLQYIKKYISDEYQIIEKYSYKWEDIKDADVVWFHNISTTVIERRHSWLPKIFSSSCPIAQYSHRRDRPIFVGGVRGYVGFDRSKRFLKYFDAIHAGSRALLEKVRKINCNSYLLNAGLDTEAFQPKFELRPTEFTIGWAGDKNKKVKNFHLIRSLGYPYKVATKENYIPHNEMPDFYNSLSTYTHFSSHEGSNRTVLEACACGLSVVSTDAGTVPEIIDPEWIIQVNPFDANRIIKEFKIRLKQLELDKKLRRIVGIRNRNKILDWDWKVRVKQVENILKNVLTLR